MDFELPEELKMIQSLVRDFVDEQLIPLERDLLGRAADMNDAQAYLPDEKEAGLVKLVTGMGLWGVAVPESLGGAGLDTLGVCLVEEELARTVVPFHFGDVTPLLFDCNDEQREKYFLPALEGKKRPYLAIMENEKADITGLEMTAVKSNGQYILDGNKMSLSRPGNDYFAVVFARLDKGPTCFLVDKDTPGFSVGPLPAAEGWQAGLGRALSLVFDDCRVSAGDILGEEGGAFNLGRQWLPGRRVVRGARSVGMARRLLEEAAVQSVSLETFGRNVGERPGIQAALADISVNIQAARLLVHEAAWKADNGKLTNQQTAMVKLYSAQMLHAVADRVAHVFNGPPYSERLPMERLCRRILANNIAEYTLKNQRYIVVRDIIRGLKV